MNMFKKICFILSIALAMPHAAVATPTSTGQINWIQVSTIFACTTALLFGLDYCYTRLFTVPKAEKDKDAPLSQPAKTIAAASLPTPASVSAPAQPPTPVSVPAQAAAPTPTLGENRAQPAPAPKKLQKQIFFNSAKSKPLGYTKEYFNQLQRLQKKELSDVLRAIAPLPQASWRGRSFSKHDQIKALLDMKAHVNTVDDQNFPPLDHVVVAEYQARGNLDQLEKIVSLLVEAKANPSLALCSVRRYPNSEQEAVLKILLAHGASIDAIQKGSNGSNLMHEAAKQSDNLMGILIANNADVNVMNGEGLLPLHIAAVNGNTDRVKQLLNAKADIEARTLCGRTALMLASHNNNINVTRSLVASNALLNAQNDRDNDNSASHYAINNGSSDCVQVLLRAKASFDTRNKMGASPLRLVFLSNKPNVHRMKNTLLVLLQKKAVTPEEVQQEAADVILKEGASFIDLETQEAIRYNPLHAQKEAMPLIQESIRQALDEYDEELAKNAVEFEEFDAS